MSDETRMTLLHSSTNDLVEELLMWRGRAAELLDRIAELEDAQRWIPVSERLPELDQDVLAIVDDDIVIGDFRKEWDGEIYFSRDEVGSTRYVTHWMPMPTFPEVQE